MLSLITKIINRHILYLGIAIIFGVFSLFQRSPYIVWAMFELNLFIILPFLLNRSQFCHPTKGAVIYFGCQRIASVYMIVGIILQDLGWTIGFLFLILGFLCKLGVFPFYSWVPRTMVRLSWGSCLVLLTLQKVFPIMCFPEIWIDRTLGTCFIVLLGIRGLLAGRIIFFQTHLKAGLGYSSILNMSWVLSLKLSGDITGCFMYSTGMKVAAFVSLYVPVVMRVIVLFSTAGVQTLADVALYRWGRFRWSRYLAVLSIGGVPGLIGFLPKVVVLRRMVKHCWPLIIILLVSSAFRILWYTAPTVVSRVRKPTQGKLADGDSMNVMSVVSTVFNISGAAILGGVLFLAS